MSECHPDITPRAALFRRPVLVGTNENASRLLHELFAWGSVTLIFKTAKKNRTSR